MNQMYDSNILIYIRIHYEMSYELMVYMLLTLC